MGKLREPQWHAATDRWTLRIGKKIGKAGKPVEASFYWLGERGRRAPADVIAECFDKQREWDRIKQDWPQLRQRLEATYVGPVAKRPDWSDPIWIDRHDVEQSEAAVEKITTKIGQHVNGQVEAAFVQQAARQDTGELIARLISAGIIPSNIIPPRPTRLVTIEEAIKEYLDHERARTVLKMGAKIDSGTYNGKSDNLRIVFGLPTGKRIKVQRDIFDVTTKLIDFCRDQVKQVIDYWYGMPAGVGSVRTVKNYLAAMKAFLNWCDVQTAYGYTKPKDIDHMFKSNDVCETEVVEYNPKLFKAIMAEGGNRLRMYGLFSLLLGYYPKDIATIREDEFFKEGNDWFIKRERSKEKGGKKTGRIIRTKHLVAPELVKLIEQHRVPNNPHGLLLLNRYGLPMYREEVDGVKHSAAQKAWETAKKRAGVKLQMKQLRKWGWNAIKRITDSKEMAQRWAGQSNGIGKAYDDSIYLPVIAAQRKFAKELKAAAVLAESSR